MSTIKIRTRETIQNLDIIDLTHRIDAYIEELANCASATRMETSEHDLRRAEAAIDHWEKRFEVYVGAPELDLPKFHPEPLRVPTPPEIRRIENRDLQQLINVWAALRIELVFSDSSERATSFKAADAARVRDVIAKLRQIIETIKSSPEIDLPDVNKQTPPAQGGN